MVEGSRYALLLVINQNTRFNRLTADLDRPGTTYRVSMKSEGLFELRSDTNTVKPHASATTPVYTQTSKYGLNRSLAELRDACATAK